MTAINFNTLASASVLSDSPAHRVYTRAAWGDSWTERTDLSCVQCIWNAAPGQSTATFYRDYGRSLTHGASSLVDRTPLTIEGHFVKVEWVNDAAGINYWLGIFESSHDSPDGITDGTLPASGSQSFAAFGMERILQLAPVFDTVWKKGTASARSGGPTAFNADGKPNRSASIITDETYVFDNSSTATYWSSRDIIKHLLFYHLPTIDGEVGSIPWQLEDEAIVPNWDRQTIETEGMTIHNIIDSLLSPRSLLGWAVGFDNSSLGVYPHSIAASNIVLDDVFVLANIRQHAFTYDADPLTRGELTIDRSDMVDQVIVRGEKRRSVFTVSLDTAQIEKDWSSGAEGFYQDGASGDAGYGTLDIIDQREANQRVREDKWSNVYRDFKIADNWDFTDYTELEDVFITDDDPPEKYEPFRGAIQLDSDLPLASFYTYEGALTEDQLDTGTSSSDVLITIEVPVSGARVKVTDIGSAMKVVPATGQPIDHTFSVEIIPELGSLEFAININGAPAWAIDSDNFTLLAADENIYGEWYLDNMHATLSVTEDRYCEAAWPASLSSADVIRRRIEYVGEGYQLVYIVPGTVTAIKSDGTEITSDGGYLRDDRPALLYLAKLLAAYHTAPRKSMSLTTHRRTGLCSVGDLVATANGTTIGAVINRIQIDAPLGEGTTTPRATQTIIATASPIDLLASLSFVKARR